MFNRDIFLRNGFVIVNDVFSSDEIDICAREVHEYCKTNPHKLFNASGKSIPDFCGNNVLNKTSALKDNTKVHDALNIIFSGDDYRFCNHNDIGVNRVVGWHKDKLAGDVSKYQVHDIWKTHEGQQHEIVKVLIYLEDHVNDNDGLKVVPGSHMNREVSSNGSLQLHPKKGDIIIFDQRITHRGMDKRCSGSRILVSFGFGKNNIFTDEFEQGTVVRQNKQNNLK